MLFVVHAVYKNVSLFTAFFYPCEVPLHQIIVHGDVAGAAAMLAFWYYVSYVKHPGVNAMLWRITLAGNVTAGEGGPNEHSLCCIISPTLIEKLQFWLAQLSHHDCCWASTRKKRGVCGV